MGFIGDTKATAMGKWAQEAWDKDLSFFTPILVLPLNHVGSEAPIPDWAMMMTAITEVGWELQSWAVSYGPKGRPHAFPVFSRPSLKSAI